MQTSELRGLTINSYRFLVHERGRANFLKWKIQSLSCIKLCSLLGSGRQNSSGDLCNLRATIVVHSWLKCFNNWIVNPFENFISILHIESMTVHIASLRLMSSFSFRFYPYLRTYFRKKLVLAFASNSHIFLLYFQSSNCKYKCCL